MNPAFLVVLLSLAPAILAAQTGKSGPSSSVQAVPLTRVVKIPMVLYTGEGAGTTTLALAPAVSKGAEDELPEGPDGFNVLDDGTIVLTDPLEERLMFFSSEGKFLKAWEIGFSADSVDVVKDDILSVRDAQTGEVHGFDREGKPRAAPTTLLPASAKLTSPTSGLVTVPRQSAEEEHSFGISIDRPGLRLVSLQVVGRDQDGSFYIAVETTKAASGDEIDLKKSVRRYSASGTLVSETDDLPLSYYIPPIDELRVRKGTVYQLMTVPSEVRINLWKMN